MKTLEIFEPAMCCSTGVCGPSVDQALVQFVSDLQWLKSHGVIVRRYNLTSDPQSFVTNSLVQKELEAGTECLPIFLIAGNKVHQGSYPSRAILGSWFGLAVLDLLPGLPSR